MLMKKKKIIFMSLAVILVLAFFINGLMEQQRAELIEQVSSSTVNETKILGEATLVDADGAQPEVSVTVGSVSSGYFADARINRQKARDEAVELLQSVVSDSAADDESKREAAEELGVIAAIIAKESNMESFVTRKDKQRASYYNYFTSVRWGDRKSYDLCINSALGLDTAVELIRTAALAREGQSK